LHDAAVADQFCDFYRGDVERVGEGFADRYATHEFRAEIIGRVFLTVEFEGGWLVVNGGCGSDDGLNAVDGVVEGRSIDERLEDGSGLAMR